MKARKEFIGLNNNNTETSTTISNNEITNMRNSGISLQP